jgi:hypothetical protein
VRIEPDGKLDAPLSGIPVGIGHCLQALFHPLGALGKVADGDEAGLAHLVVRGLYERLHTLAVADDANMKIVPHAIFLGTPEDEILQQTINRVGQNAGFARGGIAFLLGTAERILHGR